MKTAAVLYLPSGSTLAPETAGFLQAVPGLEKIYILTASEISVPWEHRPLPESALELMTLLEEAGQGADLLVYLPGDAPFLRTDLLEKLIQDHRKYRAHYTFADGLPFGLAPEILDPSCLGALKGLAAKHPGLPFGRSAVFETVSKDINAFDLETWISPRDLRPLRLSFTLDSRRNALLVDRYRSQAQGPLEDFLAYLEENRKHQRTLPAYFHIQTVTAWENIGSFDGRKSFPDLYPPRDKIMSAGAFSALMDRIQAWAGEGVVNPGLWGDPAFHPDFPALVDAVCSREGWSMVVETPLTGWKPDVWEQAAAAAGGKLTWIIELDAWEESAYRRTRGEGFQEALKGVEVLGRHFPGKVYVQLTRTKETEDQLEGFYKGWKARGLPVIIQKYDSLAGRLPDLRVNDISPLRRGVCWHLKRDFCVLWDGRLALCRTDFRGEHSPGNVFEEDLEVLWNRGEVPHEDHLKGNFGPFCGKCDEFYTYNF